MTNRFIALTEAERALKIQELILKAMAGELRWYQAAQIAGISERHMRRLKIRYEEYGCRGLFDGRKRPSLKRIRYETNKVRLIGCRTPLEWDSADPLFPKKVSDAC